MTQFSLVNTYIYFQTMCTTASSLKYRYCSNFTLKYYFKSKHVFCILYVFVRFEIIIVPINVCRVTNITLVVQIIKYILLFIPHLPSTIKYIIFSLHRITIFKFNTVYLHFVKLLLINFNYFNINISL